MTASQQGHLSEYTDGRYARPGWRHVPRLGSVRAGVHVALAQPGEPGNAFSKTPQTLLVQDQNGYWAGFFPGVQEGALYRFWVVGWGSEGLQT